MRNKSIFLKSVILGTILTPLVFSVAHADLINGGFEDGLTGWTTVVNGAANPVTVASGTTNASAGTINPSLSSDNYIYTSQSSPGNSFISQAFTVASGSNKVFFDIAINNNAGAFTTPDSLDYSGAANQQARFDILKPGSALDTMDPADIIVTAYQTQVGDPTTLDWQTVTVDVTTDLAAYVGQDVIFRFVQVDNQGVFNLALDNINVGATRLFGSGVFVPVSADNLTGSIAQALDDILSSGASLPSAFDAALTTLTGMSDTERAAALQRTAPNTGATVSNVTSQVLQGGINEIGGRINAVHSYQNSGINTGDGFLSMQPNSFWGQVSGYKNRQDMDDGFAGYEGISRSMLFGYDVTPTDNTILGVAFGYTNTDIDMKDYRAGDNAEIDSYQLSVYGSHQFENRLVLDVVGSYARHEYEGYRSTGVDTAKAEFGANHYGLRFDVSRQYEMGYGFSILPKGGLEVTSLHQQGYTETDSALSQSYDSETSNRFRSNVSVEVKKRMELQSETIIVPKVRFGWKHEFRDEGMDSTSRFVGGGSEFTTQGQAISRNTANLRAGLDVYSQNGLQVEAAVEGDIAKEYKGYGGQIKMKWAF